MGVKKRKAIRPRDVKTFKDCQSPDCIFQSREIKVGVFADYKTRLFFDMGESPFNLLLLIPLPGPQDKKTFLAEAEKIWERIGSTIKRGGPLFPLTKGESHAATPTAFFAKADIYRMTSGIWNGKRLSPAEVVSEMKKKFVEKFGEEKGSEILAAMKLETKRRDSYGNPRIDRTGVRNAARIGKKILEQRHKPRELDRTGKIGVLLTFESAPDGDNRRMLEKKLAEKDRPFIMAEMPLTSEK